MCAEKRVGENGPDLLRVLGRPSVVLPKLNLQCRTPRNETEFLALGVRRRWDPSEITSSEWEVQVLPGRAGRFRFHSMTEEVALVVQVLVALAPLARRRIRMPHEYLVCVAGDGEPGLTNYHAYKGRGGGRGRSPDGMVAVLNDDGIVIRYPEWRFRRVYSEFEF